MTTPQSPQNMEAEPIEVVPMLRLLAILFGPTTVPLFETRPLLEPLLFSVGVELLSKKRQPEFKATSMINMILSLSQSFFIFDF